MLLGKKRIERLKYILEVHNGALRWVYCNTDESMAKFHALSKEEKQKMIDDILKSPPNKLGTKL